MKSSQVTIENVSKRFGDFVALNNTSLTISKGGFYSLLGPSGCGKTTLLRIIGGFEMPSEGAVYFDGVNVLPLPPNKRHVNTIFQSYALFPHLTVFENVAFPLRLKKVAEAEIKRAVEENLTLVKMESESKKYPRLEILDRVGGGDSFASGLQFGFLQFNDAQKAVEYGAAHGALASTTPGDTSMVTRKEVEKVIGGGGARVVR